MTTQLDRSSQADKQGPSAQGSSSAGDLYQNGGASPLSSPPSVGAGKVQQPNIPPTRRDPERVRKEWSRAPVIRGLSLRAKATMLAIALSTIPVLVVGAADYFLSSKEIREDAIAAQQEAAIALGDQVGRFMYERHADIQTLAALRIFSDAKVSQITSRQEKEAQLNRFLEVAKLYDSAAVFDLNGTVIAKSKGQLGKNSKGQITNSIKDRPHFQQALKTDAPVITQPEKSRTTGKISVFILTPLKDPATGKTIAILRTRMPAQVLDEIVRTEEARLAESNVSLGQDEYYLIDADGKLFVAKEATQELGEDVRAAVPVFVQLEAAKKVASAEGFDESDPDQQLITYAPIQEFTGMPALNWSILLHEDTALVFAAQQRLLWTLAIGTGLTALLVAAIAAYLADHATRPILSANTAVERLGQGELDTRIAVKGEDELATLGSNINQMADQLQDLLREQETETRQAQLFANITASRALNAQDLEAVFNRAVQGAKQILNADRVVIYRFNPDWSGYISTEVVTPGRPQALGDRIDDSCISEQLIEAYRKGRVVPTNNIFKAGFDPEHVQLLRRLEIKANLVAPILQQDELFGLLVAHHCSEPHIWQPSEINFLSQLATQVGLSLDRVNFLEQVEQARQQAEVASQEQRQQKELLQRRALELLMEVDPVAQGDLTVRAQVTPDEVGTIADSYNAIISSLRQTVQQVQTSAQAVSQTAQGNEATVQTLSSEALRQAEAITAALNQIQAMADSVQRVAANAQQAELQAQQANQTVQAGDAAMNRTVAGISTIRETVAETAEKVKHLGEASQKISKVVSLIGDFAAQTNILAFNASIEAALAGEEGRGFAVVAEEVRSLAQQSATATAEIEQLVGDIQAETNEVAAAMEAGTKQVVTGTQLVEETRQKLGQIATASTQISTLVEGIAQAAVAQAQTSASVSQTIQEVAAIADQTSEKSVGVADSFTQLLAVAQELQVGVAQFKVK